MYIADAQILFEAYPQIGPMSFNDKHSAFRFHSLEFKIPVDELQSVASVRIYKQYARDIMVVYFKQRANSMPVASWLFIIDREHVIFIEGRE